MRANPFVSVVVCTYNRSSLLGDCIESLLAQTYPKDKYELIVIDDGSVDKTTEVLERYAQNPQFRYFRQKNAGVSSARNNGIRNSTGEIICFTDDDCRAEKDWVEKLVSQYGEGVGGVGGKIIAYNVDNITERYSEKSRFLDQEAFISLFIIGANCSYLREALEKAGYYDEVFKYGGDDVDMGIRVRSKGYGFAYAKDAIVLHNHRSGIGGMIKQVRGYGRGYARLHKKYPNYFNIGPRFMKLSLRLARKIFFLPFKLIKAVTEKDKSLALAEPFLDIFILSADIYGLVSEVYFGRKYEGNIVKEKLSFIGKTNLPGGYGD